MTAVLKKRITYLSITLVVIAINLYVLKVHKSQVFYYTVLLAPSLFVRLSRPKVMDQKVKQYF